MVTRVEITRVFVTAIILVIPLRCSPVDTPDQSILDSHGVVSDTNDRAASIDDQMTDFGLGETPGRDTSANDVAVADVPTEDATEGVADVEPRRSLVVVYNRNVPESQNLAFRYASAENGRNIHPNYIVGLDVSSATEISREGYERDVRDALVAWFEADLTRRDTARYILLIKGIPHRILGENEFDLASTFASVDNELTLLWWRNQYPLAGRLWSGPSYQDYYARGGFYLAEDESFVPGAYPVVDASGASYTLDYLVGRLDAYTYDEAHMILDRALLVSGEVKQGHGPVRSNRGWVLLDSSPERHRLDTMVDPVYPWPIDSVKESGFERLSAAGIAVLQDIGPIRIRRDDPGEFPAESFESVLAYVSWGVNHVSGEYPSGSEYILKDLQLKYVPGAAFISYESFNGYNLDGADLSQRRGQGQIADFLRMGGTVAIGNAWEPFADAVGDERVILDRYVHHGDIWIEAAYKGLRFLSWQQIVIGDPFCRVQVPQRLGEGESR
ncbi:MAG: TIGR03790 family protein [Myxococcales bacterium]|nr:TIGR03790 family protein [Myxococcales bacterium]